MTKETRHFIELADILSFQFRCKTCGASISRPISGTRNAPGGMCHNCNGDWDDGLSGQHIGPAIEELASKIRHVKRLIEHKNFSLQVEVAGPKDEQGQE